MLDQTTIREIQEKKLSILDCIFLSSEEVENQLDRYSDNTPIYYDFGYLEDNHEEKLKA